MGLDAAVYKRIEELPFTREHLRFITVDPRTGQVDFADPTLFKAWSENVKAVGKRIGNIAEVKVLRTELENVFVDSMSQSLLISKILYSETHAGDTISKDDLSSLKNEISLVRGISGTGLSSRLEHFLDDMEELIAASEQHGNPIVFL